MVLRQEVFVVEQECAYLDADGLDAQAVHLLGHDEEGLAAYGRLLPPGSRFAEPSIGRVVTAQRARGRGLGRALMSEAIAACRERYGSRPIRISAQRYLERFYRELGFVPEGEPYLEDGIPHVEMLRS